MWKAVCGRIAVTGYGLGQRVDDEARAETIRLAFEAAAADLPRLDEARALLAQG